MSQNKIIERLQALSPEELAIIGKILGVESDAKPKVETSKPKRKQTRHKQKASQELDEPDETPKIAPCIKPRPKDNLPGKPRKKTKVNRQPRVKEKWNKKGRAARTESVQIGIERPNRFETMAAFHSEKKDIKIDKLLNKGRTPSERRDPVQFIDVDCSRCGDTWEVPPSFVYNDDEGNNFICDSCRARGAK